MTLAATATAAVAYAGIAHAATPPAGVPIDPCATPSTSNYLVADATHTGVINLAFYNANGARVVFFECVGARLKELGAKRSADPTQPTLFDAAATWSCDRLARRFAAVSVLADGTVAFGSYSVRTVSCADRFALVAPSQVRPGAKARVRVVDRWGIGGIHPQLCIAPAQAKPNCATLAFPRAVTVASRDFRATTRGKLGIELRVNADRVRTSVAVGERAAPRKAPPTILATGDSTMQGVDSFLADELGDAASVRTDVRPGSGISRTTYWTFHAKSQTKLMHQHVTVMSIGAASDGLPFFDVHGIGTPCCGIGWARAYAVRVRAIMQTYLQGGRGRVVWLTPPEPRYGPRAEITHAVDLAVEAAATGLAGVKVIRIDQIFSPHGYADSIQYQGRTVRVRESDGVHLNVTGTAIAAKAVAAAIRELG